MTKKPAKLNNSNKYPKYINYQIIAKAYNPDGTEKRYHPIQLYELIPDVEFEHFLAKHLVKD